MAAAPETFADFPPAAWTLDRVLAWRLTRTPDAPFIGFGNDAIRSFAQVHALALGYAQILRDAGVGPGDRVGLFAGNSLEHIALWFAINLLGATDAPVNPALTGHTLEHALNLVDTRIVVVEAGLLAQMRASEAELKSVETVLWFGDSTGPAPVFMRIACAQLKAATFDPAVELPELQPGSTASILSTSGTTGPSKGVMVTHAQAFLTARQTAEGLWVSADDHYYCAHPLFHMSPRFCVVYAALLTGASIRFDSKFSAATWIDRIRESGATVTIGHGPLLEMIYQQPERPSDADTKLTRLGTSPFPKHIAADFERRFGLKGIETWGMTEINIPCWHPPDAPLKAGSCGKIREEWYEFQIVDPQTDEPVPVGTVGEFAVRPRLPWIISPGYFRDPAATMRAHRNLWFHSGDSGYIDADGWVYFVDRLGDRIRRRAENIASYDIEIVANAFPAVLESAAVGVPSDFVSDDDIKLCVTMRVGQTLDALALLTHLAARLPHYMVPRYIECLDAMPRTPTQKVRKAALRASGISDATWDRKAHDVALRALAKAARGV